MEIFEMELEKPLEGAMSNDGHLTRPFSDDIDAIDASLDSDRDRSSSPSPRHHKHHTQLHQHQQLHPHPLHIHPKRHHEHSHPKWDPAFPSPSSSSGSSASSSTASSVSSVSPTSMWEDGSPGQRKASTTIPAGAPRLRPHGQAVAPGLVPSGAGRAGEAAHQQQPLPRAAAQPEHVEHHHDHQQPKGEGGTVATATAVEERTSGAETREGEEAMETKQPNNSTAAAGGRAASNTKYNQMKAKYLRSLNFNEQDVQKRVLNGRHRSLSLPVARPNLGPPPSQALIQQQQSQMGASPPSSSSSSCSSSSSSPLQSPSEGPHPTAIPIPTRRGSQAQVVPPGGLGLSDFSLAPEPGVKLESSSFVPPHELVKRDTFSVWQYEKKKNAAYKAL